MTLGRRVLKRVANSPQKSPKLSNSSLRKRTLVKSLNIQIGAPSKANLKVLVRVRPENERELNSNADCAVDIVDDHMLVFDPKPEGDNFFFQGTKQKCRDLTQRQYKEQKFIFERIFDPSVGNEEVFNCSSKDLIDTLISGYNCSVFAYGATGSGKTFTMIGKKGNPGITFLTVMELYRKIEEIKDVKNCEVGVSYLEVYNEMVRDLLCPGNTLNIRENGKNVQVMGLSFHKPSDADELLKILAEGNQNRSQHPTDFNAESSRSHAVFQVFLRQQDVASATQSEVTISKLSMIDLAGSERGSATGFKGSRFREGANINRSLLALGNCINSLADGKSHIPYRDSKLTRILKDSLGGNCRSVMIANITKSSLSCGDTFKTLGYANRAKTIKMSIKKNVMNVDHHVSQYMKIIEDLKTETLLLKQRLKTYEDSESLSSSSQPAIAVSDTLSNAEKEQYEETICQLKSVIENKEMEELSKAKEEEATLDELFRLNSELKINQKKLLQLESDEKQLELKISIQQLSLTRMNILTFASTDLSKGMSKSKRLIQTFRNHIEHIQKRKKVIKDHLDQLKRSIEELCKGSTKENTASCEGSEDQDLQMPPQYLMQKRKENELEQCARDNHQINQHFESVFEMLCNERKRDAKLVMHLIEAVNHLNLKLSLANVPRESATVNLLENIYSMLDKSHIEWADLEKDEPSVEVNCLKDFSYFSQFSMSPFVIDSSKAFKTSNLRKKLDSSDSHQSIPPIIANGLDSLSSTGGAPDASEVINGEASQSNSSQPCSLPVQNDSAVFEPMNISQKLLSNDSLFEDPIHFRKFSMRDSILIRRDLRSSASAPSLLNTTYECKSHDKDSRENVHPALLRASSTFSLPSKEDVSSPSVGESNSQDCPGTSDHIQTAVSSESQSTKEQSSNSITIGTNVPSDHNYIVPMVDLEPAFEIVDKVIPSPTNGLPCEDHRTTSVSQSVNSTFSIIDDGEVAKPCSKSMDSETEVSNFLIKNTENRLSSSKKLGRSLLFSKHSSVSQLHHPPSLTRNIQRSFSQSGKLKRAESGPSLQIPLAQQQQQVLYGASLRRESVKKNWNFCRGLTGSTTKNQENVPPRQVAFGSSFPATASSNCKSKRLLNFRSPSLK